MIRLSLSNWMAPGGQAAAQPWQPMHFWSKVMIWGAGLNPSGLLHHGHTMGHPFKKTVVRMPGPSWIENFCMLNMSPCKPLMGGAFVC
jgi:hypothetical protein